MKRVNVVFLTLSVALCLVACGQNTEKQWQEQYNLGIRYLSEGNYEEAIIAFTAAIEIDPKQAPAYVGRGDACVLSGETEENLTAGQADYERAIELDETCVEAYRGLADVYIWLGEYEKAREILRVGIEKNENSGILAETLDELDGLSSNYSKYFTDNLISEGEFTIGSQPFYKLSLEAAIKHLPQGDFSDEIEIADENGNLATRHYTVYREGVGGIISCEQLVSSHMLTGLKFSDYYHNVISGVETGIRNIKTGDSMEDVLEKIGVSSQGAKLLVETGMSVTIGADHNFEGGYGWIETEENRSSVNGAQARTIGIAMDTCSCEMYFVENQLVLLYVGVRHP